MLLFAVSKRRIGGVYYYVHKKTEIIEYIGQTDNFERRHKQHTYDRRHFANLDEFDLKTYHMPGSTKCDRLEIEIQEIKKYEPPANIKSKNYS